MHATRQYRVYFRGFHFVIRTDYSTLKYLMTQGGFSEHQARHLDLVQPLDFGVEYISEEEYVVALSSLADLQLITGQCDEDWAKTFEEDKHIGVLKKLEQTRKERGLLEY